jgi:hypothetical protein
MGNSTIFASLAATLLLLAVPAGARPISTGLSSGGVAASADQPRRTARRLELLEDGPGFAVQNPAHAFGAPLTVRRLRQALVRYHARYPEAPPVLIMDLSRRGGGRLLPHASHRTGRDVDVRLILKRPTSSQVDASPRTLDAERTWFLISALIEGGDVEYVFLNRRLQRPLYELASLSLDRERLDELFQYRHPGQKVGIIRHEPGHLGHFHVRFRRAAARPLPQSSRPGPCPGALAWSRPECHGMLVTPM